MNNKSFRIGKKYIGKSEKVFIIAEIGINHGGNFKKCMKMIKAAAKAGADSVKIQTNNVDENYMQDTKFYKEFKNKNFSFSGVLPRKPKRTGEP